jgi:hypothetical protein
MVDILATTKNKRTNTLVRSLLGSQSYDHRISSRHLKIIQTLPINRDVIPKGRMYYFKSLDLDEQLIDDRFESSINQLHQEIQTTVMAMLRKISDNRIDLDEDQSYRIPFLFTHYRDLMKTQGNSANSIQHELTAYDPSFNNKYHVYNALVSGSNISQQLYNSKLAKERLSKSLGPDYYPDNNFHGMEYISPANPNHIETMRDVAVFFGALYRSGYQFKFNGTRIRRRSDILDLFSDDIVYYLYPCSRCRNGYSIKPGTLDSEFNHISDPIYGTDIRVNTLVSEIQAIVKEGSPFAFLPKSLKYITP